MILQKQTIWNGSCIGKAGSRSSHTSKISSDFEMLFCSQSPFMAVFTAGNLSLRLAPRPQSSEATVCFCALSSLEKAGLKCWSCGHRNCDWTPKTVSVVAMNTSGWGQQPSIMFLCWARGNVSRNSTVSRFPNPPRPGPALKQMEHSWLPTRHDWGPARQGASSRNTYAAGC